MSSNNKATKKGETSNKWDRGLPVEHTNKPSTKDKEKAKPEPEKLTGHADNLKGFVINEEAGTSLAQQHKELKERLVTCASSNHSAKAALSIDKLKRHTMLDFMPKPVNSDLHTDKDGKEDTPTKKVLTDVHSQQVKDCSRSHTNCATGIKDMFAVVMGQLGDSVKQKIKANELPKFETMQSSSNMFTLMALLRDLCHKDA